MSDRAVHDSSPYRKVLAGKGWAVNPGILDRGKSMEGDIHCLLGWVGALARPSPAICRNYRSVNPGITMTALGPNPDLPRCPLLRRYSGTSGHQTRLIRASRFMSTGPGTRHRG